MPTALERQGIFTDAKNSAGVLQIIKDPANGNPFPNQIIPQSRWNSYGAAILNFLPMPNTAPTATYNWVSQVPQRAPQFDEIYRADYNISDKWRFTFRLIRSHSTVLNPYTALASNNLYGAATPSPTGAWGVNANVSTIISPTLTNEFVYGDTRNYLPVNPPTGNSPYLRANSPGLAVPLLYPKADPAGMIPNLAFGGVPSGTALLASTIGNSTAYSQWYGLPYANENPTINFTDNVTKVAGTLPPASPGNVQYPQPHGVEHGKSERDFQYGRADHQLARRTGRQWRAIRFRRAEHRAGQQSAHPANCGEGIFLAFPGCRQEVGAGRPIHGPCKIVLWKDMAKWIHFLGQTRSQPYVPSLYH